MMVKCNFCKHINTIPESVVFDAYGIPVGVNCERCDHPIGKNEVLSFQKIETPIRRTTNRQYHRNEIRKGEYDLKLKGDITWLTTMFGEFEDEWMHIDVNGSNLDIHTIGNTEIEVYGDSWSFALLYGAFAIKFKIGLWNP